MSSLAQAHEYFADKREAALSALFESEPELDKVRRDAIAYFDTEYGGQISSGSTTVRDQIAEAFLQGQDREPFLRENGTHLNLIVHPEAPLLGNVHSEMRYNIFLKLWLMQRFGRNINSQDTTFAMQQAMSLWRNQYRDALNRKCDQNKNCITFACPTSEEATHHFTYNSERQIQTIAAEGVIDYRNLHRLFSLTRGINSLDECDVSGAYAEFCVTGAANFFIVLWNLGLYYTPQTSEIDSDCYLEHVQVLNHFVVQTSLVQNIRCKFGVVFDSQGVQGIGSFHVLLKHLFDKDVTQAFPRCSEMNRDLESFANIKTTFDLNRI